LEPKWCCTKPTETPGGVGDGLYRRALETALGELCQGRVPDPRAGGQILGRPFVG
jgi:hypothetical protein